MIRAEVHSSRRTSSASVAELSQRTISCGVEQVIEVEIRGLAEAAAVAPEHRLPRAQRSRVAEDEGAAVRALGIRIHRGRDADADAEVEAILQAVLLGVAEPEKPGVVLDLLETAGQGSAGCGLGVLDDLPLVLPAEEQPQTFLHGGELEPGTQPQPGIEAIAVIPELVEPDSPERGVGVLVVTAGAKQPVEPARGPADAEVDAALHLVEQRRVVAHRLFTLNIRVGADGRLARGRCRRPGRFLGGLHFLSQPGTGHKAKPEQRRQRCAASPVRF